MGGSHSKQDILPQMQDVNGIVGVELDAGLGNQLFMIATAYAYSLEHNKKLYISKFWPGISASRPAYWNSILLSCIPHLKTRNLSKFISEEYKEKSFEYRLIPKFRSVILKGYFQSDLYFKKYETDIRELFSVKYPLAERLSQIRQDLEIIESDILIAVHIRRGDYLKNTGTHTIQPYNYFEEGISHIKNKIKDSRDSNIRILYFSDDKEWVKSNFTLGPKDLIIDLPKDYEEFTLMRTCHHFVISNSTFSWWAAWLSEAVELDLLSVPKIVVAPYRWFGSKGPKNWQHIYPENWKILDINPKPIEKQFFMGILSCKKYLNRREKQDLSLCPFPYKYFLGDENLKEAKIDENDSSIVWLPCPDNYESLPLKVYEMLKWFSGNRQERFFIKADDDVKFKFKEFKDYMKHISSNEINYGGALTTQSGKSM